MTADDWIKIALAAAGGVAVSALGWVLRKDREGSTILVELRAGRDAQATDTKSIRGDIAELKSDQRDHREITSRHGERLASLEAKDDVADRIVAALKRSAG
jgi:hypothetical protein